MSNPWLVSKEAAKTITVKAPDGTEATVELCRLNEGDRMDRENVLLESRQKKGSKEQSLSYKIGVLRLFDLRKSIVAWSLPFAVADENLRKMEPSVIDQIHDAVRELNPFIFADDEDEDSPTEPDATSTSKN